MRLALLATLDHDTSQAHVTTVERIAR